MSEFILVWFLLSLSSLINAVGVLAGISVGAYIVILFVEGMSYRIDADPSARRVLNTMSKWNMKVFVFGLVMLVLTSFNPSKDDLYFIIGGGTALHVVSNEEVQKLPANLARAANDWLERYYEEERE